MSHDEVSGILSVVWYDDKNLIDVYLDVGYCIEACDECPSGIGMVGGGCEIECIDVISVSCYREYEDSPWLKLHTTRNAIHKLPLASAYHLVKCYEKSPEYKTLEDACRKDAESEKKDE